MEGYFREQICRPNARSVRSDDMDSGRGLVACLFPSFQ